MSFTKRRITVPERELTAVADMASVLAHQWSAYEATCAALAPPTITAAGEPGRSGNVPDPTAAIALGHDQYDDVRDAVHAWMEQGRWITARVTGIIREHHDLARDAEATLKAIRCDGTIDPTCTRNAVRRGLCWACYVRDRRQTAKADDQACHAKVTSSATVCDTESTSVPVEPQFPVAGLVTAEVECLPCGQRFVASGFDERVARADALILRDRHDCPARKAG